MYSSIRFMALAGLILCACGGSSPTPTPDAAPVHDASVVADSRVSPDMHSIIACEAQCVTSNAAAYDKFLGFALQECACGQGATCASACTSACASMTVPTPASPCGVCLLAEVEQGTASACVTKTGTDCLANATCAAFIGCELMCMN